MFLRERTAGNEGLKAGSVPAVTESAPIVARRASAVGAQAAGALAIGALAVGALAIGAFAVGRLSIGRARVRCLEIDELTVHKLRVTHTLQMPAQAASDNYRHAGT